MTEADFDQLVDTIRVIMADQAHPRAWSFVAVPIPMNAANENVCVLARPHIRLPVGLIADRPTEI